MRLDEKVKIRQVAGENIIMRPAGNVADLTTVMTLNESALEIYNLLKGSEFELNDVVKALTDNYDVDEPTARRDAATWVEQMKKGGLIVD